MKRFPWILCAILALALAFSFYGGKNPANPTIRVKTDTLYIHDTILREKPVFLRSRVTDTLFVPVLDTIRERDTTFVPVPREERVYGDSSYRAVVSGFRPSLDTLEIYRTEREVIREVTVTQTIAPRRWGVGVQAGYGVSVSGGRIAPAPYLGVGVYYDILPSKYRKTRETR